MEKGSKSKKESKEDPKLKQQILSELSVVETPEEQFQLLLGKHIESERVCRGLKQDVKGQENRMETILHEKDNLQREYQKVLLMRDKLQTVSNEQQKTIKSLKNENLQKQREQEDRRKENQKKFLEMTKKLKFLAKQYEMREQQFEKLNERIKLDAQNTQSLEDRLKKIAIQSEMDKRILVKEKEIALDKLAIAQNLLNDLSKREQALKEKQQLFTSKYGDFHNSLQKSSDFLASYKFELEKLSENNKKIEKESSEWKRKWENSNSNLIDLILQKKDREEQTELCTKQIDQLQKLLRTMQHERSSLYKILRENNIECPKQLELPTRTETATETKTESLKIGTENDKENEDKMEIMTKNCVEIKQTLANLESKIQLLNFHETEEISKPTIKQQQPQQQQQQQQQKEGASKKQQKKKKQKSKNKNKNSAGTAIVISISDEQKEQKEEEQKSTTILLDEVASNGKQNSLNEIINESDLVEGTDETETAIDAYSVALLSQAL